MTKLAIFAFSFVALPSCVEATWSSRSYLSSDQSSSETNRDATATAREVTRLFEVRQFQLLDQKTSTLTGAMVIKFTKSNRALAAQKDGNEPVNAHDVGSVFYAWVTPNGAAGSRVELLGKPTLAGSEPCTNDGANLPCTHVTSSSVFISTFMSGREEAQITHGVLSELQLEGYVAGAGGRERAAADTMSCQRG